MLNGLADGLVLGLAAMRNACRSLFKSEQAQDTFEYVIIIGVVVVAVILAVATPIGSTLIDGVVSLTSGAVLRLYSS
jgi:hypothetical protein